MRNINPKFQASLIFNLRESSLVHLQVGIRILASSPRRCLLGRDWLPNLPKPLVRRGKGRNLETFSSPPVPQVEGVIAQHWKPWQPLGAEDWTVEVLCSCSLIPFHHFPPMLWELLEFPSYSLRSVKTQILQAEVDKMLEKSALENVYPPGPRHYILIEPRVVCYINARALERDLCPSTVAIAMKRQRDLSQNNKYIYQKPVLQDKVHPEFSMTLNIH